MQHRITRDTTGTTNRRPGLFYGWLIVGTAFLLSMLNMGIQGSFGNFLKPLSAEFGWDRATASLPAAVAILMSGLFQPIVGQLVDRYGPRRVITCSVLLLAGSTAAVAWTTGIWYLTIVYGVVFAFASSGAGNIATSTLAARWFVRQRGRAMSVVAAGGSVGQLLVIPASMLLLIRTDWRTTYLVLGTVVLLLGVPIAALVLRNDPHRLGLLPDGDPPLPQDGSMPQDHAPASRRAPLEPARWHGALAPGPLWLLLSGFFVCGFSVHMVTTHFVPFLTDRGIAPTVAATALGLLSGCNIVGTLLAGVVSDRIGRKNPLALIYLVRALAFVLLITAQAPWMFYLFAVVAGLAWFSSVPLTIALTSELYGLRHMGTLVGMIFMSHQIGGAMSSYLAGYLFDITGSYTGMFSVSVLLLLGASVVSYAIQERRYSLKYQVAVSS